MLIYREKDNLIHKLHPFTIVIFIGAVFILSLIFSHPVFLFGLLAAVGTVIIAAGNFKEWKVYLKFSIPLIILIIIINAIFVHAGKTILLSGTGIPFLGWINISAEALAFGVGMSARLLVIISVFCLYTYAVHPDKILKLFSRWGNKSVMVITIATRLFPIMIEDYFRITEIQRCRGMNFDSGNCLNRFKKLLPVVSVLLISSLERSLQLSESMYSRGYGSGKRTIYSKDFWRPRDYLIVTAVIIGLLSGIWAAVNGLSSYNYYPVLPEIKLYEMKTAGIIMLLFIIPAILDWGWNKWPILKSKI